MNNKIMNLLILLLILRAGLAESANTYISNEPLFTKTIEHHKKPWTSPLTSTPTPTMSSQTSPLLLLDFDKCAENGIISDCTAENPYCFVDGDNISCGPAEKIGWRISPLDGLILNNGQKPNPNCELFIQPKIPETKKLIMELLIDSEFGSGYENSEPAWFNIFDYLGNCPLKFQFCDQNTLTCQYLFGAGKNCTSSNQCLSRSCEKYDKNAPNDTTERKCVEGSDTRNSSGTDNANETHMLLIIISISVVSAILLLGISVCLIKAQRKQRKRKFRLIRNSIAIDPLIPPRSNDNESGFVAKHLSALHSSLLSRISLNRSRPPSKNVCNIRDSKDSSVHLSVLLPPPPAITSSYDLYRNDYNRYFHSTNDTSHSFTNSRDSRDSFDIYPPPSFSQQQFQYELSLR